MGIFQGNNIVIISINMMERVQKKPQSQLAQRTSNFPVLRKSSSLSKPIISLVKVELESNMGNMDSGNSKSQPRQILTSFSHKRIGSGVSIRQIATQANFHKTSRSHFQQPKIQPKRLNNLIHQSSNIGSQSNKDLERFPPPIVDKAKTSTKAIGSIKGYAVNSHPGPLNLTNEDRICIVTNLTRSSSKENQVSFFSVYDGKQGIEKAEYFRDNFHNLLSRQADFLKDIELSIKKTFLTVEQGFKQKYSNKTPLSSTALNIVIVKDEKLFLIQSSESRILTSRNFGNEIENPLIKSSQDKNQQNLNSTLNKYKYFIKSSQKFHKKPQISIKTVSIEDLDFIVLGSEGLFQNISQFNIGTKIWQAILKSQSENLHLGLGQALNVIMNDVFSQMSTKNVSVILIAFKNVMECISKDNEIELPFVEVRLDTQEI